LLTILKKLTSGKKNPLIQQNPFNSKKLSNADPDREKLLFQPDTDQTILLEVLKKILRGY